MRLGLIQLAANTVAASPVVVTTSEVGKASTGAFSN